MIVYRVGFQNYVSELMIPQNANGTVIVFLPGLPNPLAKNPVSELLFNAGYTVFQPFFSGSFDSGGAYQPSQCVQDVAVFAKMARQGVFQELFFSKQITYPVKRCLLLAPSFGGSIAALSNKDGYDGIVLLAPVLTYNPEIITANGGGDSCEEDSYDEDSNAD